MMVKNKEKINFLHDIIDGIIYLRTRKNILNIFEVFIALNFFIGLSINVPMPYIINNVLKLNTKFFGIIQAAFPVGMILGALIIKRIMNKYSYEKIIKSTSILLSVCMIAIGFSVILHYKIYNENILFNIFHRNHDISRYSHIFNRYTNFLYTTTNYSR